MFTRILARVESQKSSHCKMSNYNVSYKPEGGNSHTKRTDSVLVEILKKKPKSTKILLQDVAWIVFHRYFRIISCYMFFFRLRKLLTSCCRAPEEVLNPLLTPERFYKHHVVFYMGVPSPTPRGVYKVQEFWFFIDLPHTRQLRGQLISIHTGLFLHSSFCAHCLQLAVLCTSWHAIN